MSRILVVDDDTDILSTIAMVLDLEGHQCTSVSDSRDALVHLGQESFDLIVLDYRMPEISGAEIHRLIRARGDLTPVLFLSADRDITNVADAQGVTAAMTKPFDIGEFLDTVSRLAGEKPGPV